MYFFKKTWLIVKASSSASLKINLLFLYLNEIVCNWESGQNTINQSLKN